MASLTEKQIGPGPVPVWDIQTASAGQIDACCGLGKGVNLLDNWYLVGGGSQQGGEQFPINQRGQTTWTSSNSKKYIFDRWWQFSGTVSLVALGLASVNGFIAQSFSEYIAQYLDGKVITFSVFGLVDNVPKCISLPLTYHMAGGNSYKNTELGDAYVAGIDSGVGYFVQLSNIPAGVVIQAFKLELGPVSTLAYQDASGNVLLSDPVPNFGLELLKCQRCFQTFATQSLRPTQAEDFRPAMRANPTLGTITVGNKTLYTASADL